MTDHHHHHHHDHAAYNKEYFNENAEKYELIPFALERAKRSAQALRKHYAFNKDTTTAMDFASGTGIVSREMLPYVKSILGVDISPGMVEFYNKRFTTEIPSENCRAVCAELKGEKGELDDAQFDVIYCTSAFHHFTSVDDVARILASHLKPSGVLMVIDNAPMTEESFKKSVVNAPENFRANVEHVVAHTHGFTEEDFRKVLEGAGLQEYQYELLPSSENDVDLFIATGKKPAASV